MTRGRRRHSAFRAPHSAFAVLMMAFTQTIVSAAIGPPPTIPPRSAVAEIDIQTGRRDVEVTGFIGASTISPAKLDMGRNAIALKMTYCIAERFSAHGILGTARANLGTLGFASGFGNLSLKGDHSLLVGIGADYVFPELAIAPDLRTGISGEYRVYKSGILGGEINVDEFTFAAKASHDMDPFVPYAGVLVSTLNADFKGQTSTGFQASGNLEADDKFGVLLGLDYRFTPRLKGQIEFELVSSTYLKLGAVYELGGPYWFQRSKPQPTAAPPPAEPTAAPEPEKKPVLSKRREKDDTAPVKKPRRKRKDDTAPAVQPPPDKPAKVARAEAPVRPRSEDRRDVRAAEEQVKLGNELTELGRIEEAMTFYRRAIALDPGNFRAHYNLATLLYRRKDFTAAKKTYLNALEIDPLDVQAHLYLGFCHYRLGDVDAAARSWQRVLELDPTNAVALNNLQAIDR